ncbi:evolutionarily conserved signaling intermediate in Toll pathway, mitochondrial-like [Dendronephthya gigantea]|uniref:evolutionarily conserved signaling intermediate in Toll pathway, mitochondrial-like n=1 Tax=Dendronephthya gigantea TaxID=151771 RepID=UPI00106B1058|nr:evolutionarily conserved signaling intermediate in Toll pathway, mitochondrial-like [Dendronephthya gigantea]
MLRRLLRRHVFTFMNRNLTVKMSFKSRFNASAYIFVRFQHEQANLSENRSGNAAEKHEEAGKELTKSIPKQVNRFPLKHLTKSAQIFEKLAVSSPDEQGFCDAIETFKKRDVKRIKAMDFIKTAMTYMEPFGVAKNVESYNQLLDLFPKGRYHYRTVFDTLWTRYRPQIDCAVQVLTKLEENRLRPNVHTYDIVEAVFGNDSIPLNKLRRIVFWFDKFDEMYPDPLPKELPSDREDLFMVAINRMVNENMDVEVTSFKNQDGKKMEIIGAQNKYLSNFLLEYDFAKPVFVEGPQMTWLRKTKIFYYVLKADINPSVVDEDRILALCILGDNEGEDELKIWIKELQKDFPRLAELNIIFNVNINNKL